MSAQDREPLYAIYNGPRPVTARRPPATAADARGPGGSAGTPDEAAKSPSGALVLAALIAGVALGAPAGYWLRAIPPAAPAASVAGPVPSEIPASDVELFAADPASASRSLPDAAPAPQPAAPGPRALTARTVPAKVAQTTRSPCARIESEAERLACSNPDVAGVERELKAAYDRARVAGVAAADLDYPGWTLAREEAAHQSAGALIGAYRERIEEVQAMAEPPH